MDPDPIIIRGGIVTLFVAGAASITILLSHWAPWPLALDVVVAAGAWTTLCALMFVPVLLEECRARRRAKPDQAGSITVWLAMLGVALLALAGLVADGGSALTARAKAASDAFSAARAGAEAMSQTSIAAGVPVVDNTTGQAAAQAVLAADQATGTITISGGQVTVQVNSRVPTLILSLVGYSHIDVSATASAGGVAGP